DDAVLGAIDIAIGKARTAALFRAPTEALWDYARPGGPSPGLENSNGGLVVFPGGLPLFDATGQLLGAIGVSGGAPSQDLDIATAAAAALAA
ncbi:MAG: heme-binding protein, partial [Pseudoxanthomonas sp.]|nr:heme-binding protein [Pseudoxanthomonas sp.]